MIIIILIQFSSKNDQTSLREIPKKNYCIVDFEKIKTVISRAESINFHQLLPDMATDAA